MDFERLFASILVEHADFLSYLSPSEMTEATVRQMEDFVENHLSVYPQGKKERAALAEALAHFINGPLANATELATCRSMLRTLARYDMAAENLLFALTCE